MAHIQDRKLVVSVLTGHGVCSKRRPIGVCAFPNTKLWPRCSAVPESSSRGGHAGKRAFTEDAEMQGQFICDKREIE